MYKISQVWKLRDILNDAAINIVLIRAACRLLPYALLGLGKLSGPPWQGGTYLISLFRSLYLATTKASLENENDIPKAVIARAHGSILTGHADQAGYRAARAIDELVAIILKGSDAAPSQPSDLAVYLGSDSEAVGAMELAMGRDIEFLLAASGSDSIGIVSIQPLWHNKTPDWFDKLWSQCDRYLRSRPDGFDLWAGWYQYQIDGSKRGFGLGKEIEATILSELGADNAVQWRGSPSQINLAIRELINERRQQFKTVAVNNDDRGIEQNVNAIVWEHQPESGLIGVNRDAGLADLILDSEAETRHSESVLQAQEIVRIADLHSNSSGGISLLAQRYIEAAGSSLNRCSPSLLVTRGERLRQKLAFALGYDDSSMTPPLVEDLIEALMAWQSAHNLLVGLDPALSLRDRALLGPDAKLVIVRPSEINSLADKLYNENLLSGEGHEDLTGIAGVAPQVPDAADRRSRIASESAKNLAILLIDMALKSPTAALVLGAASIVGLGVLPTAAGGLAIAGALKYVRDHQPLLRAWFKDSKAMLGVLDHLIDRLDGKGR